jgi:LTXXQ motif family protein
MTKGESAMQQHDKWSSYMRAISAIFFGAVALSAVLGAVGALSLPADLDQLRRGNKDQARFGSDGPFTELSKGSAFHTIEFMPYLGMPPAPAHGMMGPPPFPVPRPEFGDRMQAKLAPRKVCLENISRDIAIYAYIKSELQLTDNQKEAAKVVDDAVESSTSKLRALCQNLPTEIVAPPGIIERVGFMEKQLAARLELLRALKGPVQDLLEQLTPDQRALLDQPPSLMPLPPL